MIATHNIKVNGRWVQAGEYYEAEEPEKKAEEPVKVPEEKPVEESPKEETAEVEIKPKTTRRKVS